MTTLNYTYTGIPVWFDVNQDNMSQYTLDQIAAGTLIYVQITDGQYDTINISGSNTQVTIGGTVQPLIVKGTGGNDSIFVFSDNVTVLGHGDDDATYIYGEGCSVFSGSGQGLTIANAAATINGGSGFDQVFGSQFGDTIFGAGDSDQIVGNGGNDAIYGGSNAATPFSTEYLFGGDGNDLIHGGGGVDYLFGDGPHAESLPAVAPGQDTLKGGHGNDFLFGGAEDDKIFGGADDDWIFGEEGNDILRGGAGNDRFFFSNTEGWDTTELIITGFANMGRDKIKDFTQGADVIQFAFKDPATQQWAALEDFTWRGDAGLLGDGTELQIAFQTKSNKTKVLFDQDGDGTAEITVDLIGFTDPLTYADIGFW
ncbi:MAG: calcium-binding protein [Rhodobacteraceae bacterium]|nr:calcium-binding protein [Paracoccaceae bacterium]